MLRCLSTSVFLASLLTAAPQHYTAKGLVIAIDPPGLAITVSHAAIPNYMEAMSMRFHVRDGKWLAGLHAGDYVAFDLVVDSSASWVEALRVIPFDSPERDPSLASKLKLLDSVTGKSSPRSIAVGEQIPDFTLTDQANRPVTLSELRGKVVALNFVYTRCPLPDYCFRLSSNFASLRKRFSDNGDLVLLTVTFDPVHDQPDVLARYAEIWRANPATWHFLTGDTSTVERVSGLFGVAHWRDDGLFTHSLRTAVINRQGRAVAIIEGNVFTAKQLGDLVEAVLRSR